MSAQCDMLRNFFRTENLILLAASLCPVLVLAHSVADAMVMGMIFSVVLVFSTILFSLLRYFIPYTMRLLMLLIVVAFVVTVVELLMRAFYYEWYLALSIYIPLLSMNCLILSNIEESISVDKIKVVVARSLMTSLYVWGVLLLASGINEYMILPLMHKDDLSTLNFVPTIFLLLGFIIAFVQYINILLAKSSSA